MACPSPGVFTAAAAVAVRNAGNDCRSHDGGSSAHCAPRCGRSGADGGLGGTLRFGSLRIHSAPHPPSTSRLGREVGVGKWCRTDDCAPGRRRFHFLLRTPYWWRPRSPARTGGRRSLQSCPGLGCGMVLWICHRTPENPNRGTAVKRRLWVGWIAASTVGGWICAVFARRASIAAGGVVGDILGPIAAEAAVGALAMGGILLGVAAGQWLVIRARLSWAGRLALATTLAGTAGGATGLSVLQGLTGALGPAGSVAVAVVLGLAAFAVVHCGCCGHRSPPRPVLPRWVWSRWSRPSSAPLWSVPSRVISPGRESEGAPSGRSMRR